jgi:hypothetical protein
VLLRIANFGFGTLGDNPIYTMADARRACRGAPRRPRNLLPNFAVPGYFNK